jgi:hypothetical protein
MSEINWKAPPADTSKLWLNKSLEIQLLLACNWSCHACDQFSQFSKIQWVKKGTLTVAQVQKFIAEMQEHNAYFGRIRLVGGEPTIHPQFAHVVKLLHEGLIIPGHVGILEVVTNGSHPERIEPVKQYIHKVRPSGEAAKQKNHTANLIHTPASLGYQGNRCGQPEHCGWSLSYYGYAPCSSAAGIMRLRDLIGEHGKLTLPLVKGTEANWPKLQDLCNQCYHALRDEDKIKCGTGQRPEDAGKNDPGPEINAHLEPWLHGKVPTWPAYGG